MTELQVNTVHQEELVSLDYGNRNYESQICLQMFGHLARACVHLASEIRIFLDMLMLAKR